MLLVITKISNAPIQAIAHKGGNQDGAPKKFGFR